MDGNVSLANAAPLKDVFHCMSSGLGLVFRRRQDSAHKILDQDMM